MALLIKWHIYRTSFPFFYQKVTQPVNCLELGMKLECLDINNPVNYCVATIIKIYCHRICLRYDGFGDDSSHDFWCNFQAEELFPIGWCAQKNYPLQPPTGNRIVKFRKLFSFSWLWSYVYLRFDYALRDGSLCDW